MTAINFFLAAGRRAFSFSALLGVLLAALAALCTRLNLADPDTWWHVEIGRQILTTRSLPSAETYSHTAQGAGWIAYEWLGEILFALAARVGDLRGLAALLMLLSAIFIVLLYYYAYLTSRSAQAAFTSCCVLLPIALVMFRVRPQLLGYIFFLATLICLERYRQGRPAALWFLPAIFLLWVNTHGSFLLGFVAVGAYWLGGTLPWNLPGAECRRWSVPQQRQFGMVSICSLLCLTITPYGTRLAAYPLEMALFQPVNRANINEWQHMRFDLLHGKLFLILILLYFLAVVVFRPIWRLDTTALLLFAIFSASVHIRFLIVFLITVATPLSTICAAWFPRRGGEVQRYALNAALMALVAVGMLWIVPSREQLTELLKAQYPQQAVQYLTRQRIPGPWWNEYGWGGFLMWSWGPGRHVFIDGRADVYEYAGVLTDYMRVSNVDRSSMALLRRYGIAACLVRRDSPLATLLAANRDWELAYADSLSSIFVRRSVAGITMASTGSN